MIKIRNEADFNNWFRENYKSLGFSKIIRKDISSCPDFIMLDKNEKKVKVELEIKSSNFILHGHNPKKVDRVICVEKDQELNIPTTEVRDIRIVEFEKYKEPSFSTKNKIFKLVRKDKVVTSSEIAKYLKVSWNTAERYLMELLIENKIERIKKEKLNLWMLK